MKRNFLMQLLLLVILITFSITAQAVPANPKPIDYRLPDGTTITITLKGDEKVRWAETLDGYSVLLNKDGFYEYCILNEKGDMVRSGIRAFNESQRTNQQKSVLTTISKGLGFSASQVSMMKQVWNVNEKESSKAFPTTGSRKLICILIGYTDKAFTKTQTDFNNLYNQIGYSAGGATGSVKDYYLENSYNQFDLTVDVAGPYTASNNMAYYGANDGSGYDLRPDDLVTEAVNLADAAVDFSDYDNDSDGSVDGVYIIYAGYGEEAGGSANAIWAHAWEITPVTKDGVSISRYSCSAELRGSSGTNMTHIGVICHEFGHVLGAPDYYDTNYGTGGQYQGTGDWDMMAGGSWNNNGATPAHHNGFTKVVYYNWATATELTTGTTITLNNAAENSNSFYRINTNTSGEYYFIENREQHLFDANIPGSGMMIYHVHSGVLSAGSANTINDTHPQKMYPVAQNASSATPTSTVSTYGTIDASTCPWTGTGKTEFTDASTPCMKSWAGVNTNKPITNISRNASNKTVTFDFMGGAGDNPTNFALSAVSSSQIDASWTRNSSRDVLLVFNTTSTIGTPTNGTSYSAGNAIPGGGTVLYAGPAETYSHTGLSAQTTYYYKIFTKINSTPNWSTGVADNETTLCGTITTFPYEESFENGGTIPSCWSQEIVTGSNNWTFVTSNGTRPSSAQDGSYFALFKNSSNTADKTRLVAPIMDLSSVSSATLTFWHHQAVWTPDQDELRIYYKTSSGGSWTLLESYTTSVTSWTERTLTLPNLSATYYIAFEGTAKYGYGACLDNVTVTSSSPDPEPTNHPSTLAAGTTTTTSITLTWTDATAKAQAPSGYLIKGSTVSYAAISTPVDGTPESDATLVKNVAQGVQTVTFSSLTAGTTYYFKIFPYTNSGATIDYKTNGTVVQASGATLSGGGPYGGTGSFTKITSLVDLTDGYYVVVNSGDGFAMNNTNVGSYFQHTVVTPSSNTITDPATTIVWKIESHVDGGHTIYNEASSKYVSYTGSSNASYAVDAVTSGAQRWTFTYASSVFSVANVTSTSRILQYNSGSPRFACYTTAQQKLLLYKMVSSSTPTITLSTATLSGFSYTEGGGPSTAQQFTVSGSDLTANITLTASTNYEISQTEGSGYTSPITLTQSGGTVGNTTIYARLKAGLSAATYNGETITAASTDATSKTVTCNGEVTAAGGSPTISVSVASLDFEKVYSGFYSRPQKYTVTGTDLTADITVTAPTGMEVTTDCAGESPAYGSSVTLTQSGGSVNTTVYARYTGGAVSANITHASTGATTQNISISETENSTNLPVDYYSSASGSGATLKTSLKNIITAGHSSVSYTALWTHFVTTDSRPDGSVWDIYTDNPCGNSCSFTFGAPDQDDGTGGTAECQKYNREHTFPASWFNDATPTYTDMFHLMPTDKYVNNQRSSYCFGEVTTGTTYNNGGMLGTNTYSGAPSNTCFEPSDEYKGDIARNYFYIATRYESDIDAWEALDINTAGTADDWHKDALNGTEYPCFDNWFITMLLEWHTNDPVDQKEKARNDAIYIIQGNRNPFIDNPDYANDIWGTPTVDPEPTNQATGFSATANGSSQIDLSWTDAATGSQAPDGYLILANTSGTFTAPTDTNDPTIDTNLSDGSAVVKVTHGTESYSFTGLTAETTYYFKMWSYTNSGSNIDFKTDGTPPTGNATTGVASGGGCPTTLFISEYGEGSSSNKYIEIYNGTGSDVNLGDYALWLISNGGSWPETTLSLSGTLVNGDVYVVCNTSASATITASADLQNATITAFNGDDAIGLAKSGILIDAVGTDGADPGTGWNVAGTTNGTVDRTLVRKSSVMAGNTDWSTSAGTNTTNSEWEVYASDTWTYIGAHTMDACGGSTPTLTVNPSTLTGFTYQDGSGPSTVQSFTISGTDLDGTNVILTAPTNYEISTSNFSATSPITLTAFDGTETTIYVRLKSGLSTGTFNGETISITGGGDADGSSVTCSGEVTAVPNDSDSQVSAGAGSEPATIASTVDTDGEEIMVFDFTFTDAGTADGLATIIDQIQITQGSANDVADWRNAIAGAYLSGTDLGSDLAGTVNAINITFASNDMISIADGGNETYTLKIYLKTDLSNINDNDNLEFALSYSNITADAAGSSFGSGAPESGDANVAVTIMATKLLFVQQPTNTERDATMSPAVTVEATDANGNRDLDNTATVGLTSTGTMTAVSDIALSSGFGTYGNIVHTSAGTGLELVATHGSLANATSSTFNISNPVVTISEELFTTCPASEWNAVNVLGSTDQWTCAAGTGIEINGYGDENDEDWLILSTSINFNAYTSEEMTFVSREKYSGPDLELYFSADFTGTFDASNVSAATWTLIPHTWNDVSTSSTYSTAYDNTVDLSGLNGTGYIAFKYSGTSSSAEGWLLDDIIITGIGGNDVNSTVSAGAGSEPATIASTVDTDGEEIIVFDFTFTDAGTTDGLATIIDQIRITQGSANDVANWTNAIAGVYLSGTDLGSDLAGTVNTTNITFASDDMISIADGGNETYTLKIYLKTDLSNITDNDNLEFALSYSNITTDAAGSAFGSGAPESGDANVAVTITATKLLFVQQPSNTEAGVAMSPSVTVEATDVNGNRDADFTSNIQVSSTGTLTGTPVSVAAIAGLATYSTLTHTAIGTGLTLTAERAGTADWDVTSNTFNITANNAGDIILEAMAEPTNIDYSGYQAANIVGGADDIEVAQFTIRDGGGSSDADGATTTLTDIAFSLSNHANIRRVAIYDGASEIAEVDGAATVTFNGISLIAADNGSKTFSIRVSFNTAVTDNEQFQFTVTSATFDAGGSGFAAANAGGASSSVTGDENRIEVTASELQFVQQPSETMKTVTMSPSPTVKACDANGNVDADYGTAITITSSGTLSATPITGVLTNGVATFAIKHTETGTGLQLTASSSGLSDELSSTFDIIEITFCSDLMISEYIEGDGNNKAIELFNGTGSVVDLSNYQVGRDNGGNGTYWTLGLTGTLAHGDIYLIVNSGGADLIAAVGAGNIDLSTASDALFFNGDDKVALFKDDGSKAFVILDLIDPFGTNFATVNLERNGDVFAPKAVFDVTEWTKHDPYTYTTLGETENPLPINLIYFNAQRLMNHVQLQWATASEQNNQLFTVDRSSDMENWITLGTLPGAGNSNSLLTYSFMDINPLPLTAYYRLKQTDYNGVYTYSNIAMVSSTQFDINNLVLFPNPSKGVVTILGCALTTQVFIYNSIGELLLSGSIDEDNNTIDLSQQPNGIYFVSITRDGNSKNSKIVISK